MVAVRLVGGLVLFGAGIACLIRSELGVGPWDVLHLGLADVTGASVGTVVVVLGAVLLGVQVALREQVGLGTLANVVIIGPSIDLFVWLIPETGLLAPRIGLMLVGPLIVGIGSGFYLGVHRGPGPRDALMTAIARRAHTSLRLARFTVEATALAVGWALGGPVGIGTLWFAVSVGPFVQRSYERLAISRSGPPE